MLFILPGLDGDNLKLIDGVDKAEQRAAALKAALDELKKVGKTLAVLAPRMRWQKCSYADGERHDPCNDKGCAAGCVDFRRPWREARRHLLFAQRIGPFLKHMHLQIYQLKHHVVVLWLR